MLKIKFSSDYTILGDIAKDGDGALLLEVFEKHRKDMSDSFIADSFIAYDTYRRPITDGKYPLPHENYLILLFEGRSVDYGYYVFTTISLSTPKKKEYYLKNCGRIFKVEIIKNTEIQGIE